MNTEMAPGGRRPLDQANRLDPQARLVRRPNHDTVTTMAIFFFEIAIPHISISVDDALF